jgi:YidC/Oxa1 family membrane protein insertase
MDKNTLLAVVLSVVVITVGFMVQNIFFAPAETPAASRTKEEAKPREQQTTAVPSAGPSGQAPAVMAPQPAVSGTVVPASDDTVSVQNVVLETDLLHATFSTKGAVLRSLKLKEHKDKDGFVDMVKTGTSDDGAFSLAFGGADAKPLDAVFRVRKKDNNTLEFFKEFQISGYENSTFRLTKSFSMRPGEYLVLLDVTLENVDNPNQYLPLNFNNVAYTLGYGPQIGPDFEKLDGQHDYRKFYVYADGKRKDVGVNGGKEKELDQKANWVGIVGKYFALLAAPVYSDFQVTLSSRPMEGISQSSMLFISKPVIKSSKNTDSYRFFAGPKVSRDLGRYNDKEKNAFGIQNMQFDEALDSNIFLGWLENILKFLLRIFYGIIPNWGVAIILVTIAVKVITFPLTQKSYKSTGRMQSLAPKMEELKKKYKDNPAKLNQETADLYKREGINPMSGCLPMLLQIPIFFAMYGLFSNHFDLRGAAFLPPWITDLSAPESIWSFAPFKLPIVGWSDLRLLPVLFVATQLLSGTMMQTPGTGSNAQMKMMTYGIPIVFFFVLYDVPSGLLVYWIVMNVLTIVQQMFISKAKKAKA